MKYFLIGIGGISMSALAQFLADQGHQVLGSDICKGPSFANMVEKGIEVFTPQQKENITPDIDEVVYTSAITSSSPGMVELQAAKNLGIKTTKRAQKIGELTKKFKTVAVAGTHGKSTTTAMVLQIMVEAGENPSALLGSNFDFIGSNYLVGKGRTLVIESDEFDRSFHNFYVDYGAILNLEADHLDYFKGGIAEIKEVYLKYIQNNFNKNGYLVYNADDKNLREVISKLKRPDLKIEKFPKIKLNLSVPGEHNQQNARAAFALARKIGIKDKIIRAALFNFKGASRRFELLGKKRGVTVIDDYAHHPTEVKATLQAAREKFKKKRIIAVFQPHQYSRTYFFAQDFAKSFYRADFVIIPPIYEVVGRDEEKKIDNYKLVEMIKKNNQEAVATKDFAETVKFLKKAVKSGDIILTMGAGPVNQVGQNFLKN